MEIYNRQIDVFFDTGSDFTYAGEEIIDLINGKNMKISNPRKSQMVTATGTISEIVGLVSLQINLGGEWHWIQIRLVSTKFT